MKIAQFKSMRHDYISVLEWPLYAKDEPDFTVQGYVRLTEWMEAEFVPLPPQETIPQQLEALDRLEQPARSECNAQLAAIEEARGKLLALTHEAAA